MHQVASDPGLQEEYKNNPEAVIDRLSGEHGMSDEHKQVLLSDNSEDIMNAIAGKH
jgi:hypothetical protein